MVQAHGRPADDTPAGSASATTEIDVFVIEEESLVEPSEVLEQSAPDAEKRPGHPRQLDVGRREGGGQPGTEPAVKADGQQGPHKVATEGRFVPSRLGSGTAILIDLERGNGGHVGRDVP